MAHHAQQDFCNRVRGKFAAEFASTDAKILDCGSLDINGNNRSLFASMNYTGIDLGPGKNVDVISRIHEFRDKDESYDIIVSTECLEHDEYYAKSLQNMLRLLKPGGILFFTCATTGRAEHGTWRSDPTSSPFTQTYYKNLTPDDIRASIPMSEFSEFNFEINAPCGDMYFWGKKKDPWLRRKERNLVFLTAPRNPLYLHQTIASMHLADPRAHEWKLWLVVDNAPDKSFIEGYLHHERVNLLRTYPADTGLSPGQRVATNFARMLREMPRNERLVICEDDIVFRDGWCDALDRAVEHIESIGSTYVLTGYAPYEFKKQPVEQMFASRSGFYGAQFLFLPPPIRESLATYMVDNKEKAHGDILIQNWGKDTSTGIFAMVPSIVQHMGHVSGVNTPPHQTKMFPSVSHSW